MKDTENKPSLLIAGLMILSLIACSTMTNNTAEPQDSDAPMVSSDKPNTSASEATEPSLAVDSDKAPQPSPIVKATPSLNEPVKPAQAQATTKKNRPPKQSKTSAVPPTEKKNSQAIAKKKAVVKVTPVDKKAAVKKVKKPQIKKPKLAVKKTPSVKKKSTTKTNFSGNVTLLGASGETLSPKGIIVLLEPDDHAGHKSKPATTLTVDMVNKQYVPIVSTLSKEQLIKFRNKDQVKHNVFSSSAKNSFDLGTYGQGKVNDVSFEQEGIVKVYCNIHPDMVAFVGVSTFNYSAIVDDTGTFQINALPRGSYQVRIWSPRGEVTERIYLSGRAALKKSFLLNTANHKPKAHKNKFGKNYDDASLFDDEFY